MRLQLNSILICCFLLTKLQGRAQENSCFFELMNRSLIIGFENSIELFDQNNEAIKIVKLDAIFTNYEGQIEPLEIIGFNIKPTKTGTVHMTISTVCGIVRKSLRTEIPKATVSFGNIPNGSVARLERSKIISQKGLAAKLDCCDSRCQIMSFDIIILKTDNTVIRSKNIGYTFTEEMNQFLEEIIKGDIILIKNIKHRCPGDIDLRIDEIIIEVD